MYIEIVYWTGSFKACKVVRLSGCGQRILSASYEMRDWEVRKVVTWSQISARCLVANAPSYLVLTNVLSEHQAECSNLINCCFYEPQNLHICPGNFDKNCWLYFFPADKFVQFNFCLWNIILEIAFYRCVFAILTEKTSETSATLITEN